MSAKNESGMRGTVVWVCEKGHPDLLHKYEGNYLGLCFTCRDGSVCEPRFTPGRRSQEQRERDKEIGESYPRFEEERRKRRERREVPAPIVSSEVTVTRRGGAREVVGAETFDPQAIEPPFTLSAVQCQQILSSEAKMPEITFPRQRPAEVPAEAPWPPATPGDVVPVSERVAIVVLGTRVRVDSIVLKYEVRDGRDGRGDPIKTTKPLDPKVPATTLVEQFRPEPEPQGVTRAEATEMAEEVHAAELRRHKDKRARYAADLEELGPAAPRDLRRPITLALEAFDFRIAEIERRLKTPDDKQRSRRSVEEAEEAERREQTRKRRETEQRKGAATWHGSGASTVPDWE